MKRLVTITLGLILIFSSMFCITVSSASSEEVDITRKGSIILTKYDKNTVIKDSEGNITNGNKLKGATFSAYRILDFDGKAYSVNSSFKDDNGKAVFDFDKILYTGSTNSKTEIAGSYGSTSVLEEQILEIQDWILNNSVTAVKSAVTDETGVASLSELPLGVYIIMETTAPEGYIISTQPFLVSLPTWNGTKWLYEIDAKPKNEAVSLKKEFTKAGNSSEMTSSDSYSIGDTIPYKIIAKIPNYGMSEIDNTKTVTGELLKDQKGVEKFNKLKLVFTDTFSKGLTLNISSIDIKVDGNELSGGDVLKTKMFNTESSEVTETTGSDYTTELISNGDGTGTLNINISWSAVDNYQGKDIIITYDAQLNTEAVVGSANTNEIKYNFSIDPQSGIRNNLTDNTEVYTYQLNLTKTFNGKSATERLVDASKVVFNLFDEDNQTVKLKKLSDGSYTIWNGSDENTTEAISPTTDGLLSIKGFGEGKYSLKEIATADKCILLEAQIYIWVYEVENAENTALTANVKAHTMKYDESTQKYIEDTDNDLSDSTQIGAFKLTVNNIKAYDLPISGDLGICLITVIGLIGITLSIMIFVYSKKKSQK